jgi:hypothetical protein
VKTVAPSTCKFYSRSTNNFLEKLDGIFLGFKLIGILNVGWFTGEFV